MLNMEYNGRRRGTAAWVMMAALMAAPSTIALAQTGTTPPPPTTTGAPNVAPNTAARPAAKGQPVRRGRVMKPAIVNLEAQAGLRREGQVLPGDPPPEKFAPPAPPAPAAPPAAAAPAAMSAPAPSREAELPLESSAPPPPPPVAAPMPTSSPSKPLKPAPTPVDPESGPRPLPRMPEMSQAAPSQETQSAAEVVETVDETAAAMDEGVTMEPASATASVETPGAPAIGRSTPVPTAPIVASEPEAPRLEWLSAEVTVESASGRDVQWRAGDAAWNTPATGARESGRVEVRTGPEGEALVNVDGQVSVRVAPLSRIVIERRAGLKLLPSVLLERGTVDLRAQSSEPVETWVRTPDRRAGFATWPGVRISYNAFSGTSVQAGAEIAQPR